MRAVFLRLIGCRLLAFAARATREAAFCASYFNGGTNCGFATLQQCLESVRGVGGQCGPAPGSAGEERRRPDRPEARPRREPERRPRRSHRATAQPPRREAVSATAARADRARATGADRHAAGHRHVCRSPRAAPVGEIPAGDRRAARAARRRQSGRRSEHRLCDSKIGRLDEAKLWLRSSALAMNPDHLWAVAYSGICACSRATCRAHSAIWKRSRRSAAAPAALPTGACRGDREQALAAGGRFPRRLIRR